MNKILGWLAILVLGIGVAHDQAVAQFTHGGAPTYNAGTVNSIDAPQRRITINGRTYQLSEAVRIVLPNGRLADSIGILKHEKHVRFTGARDGIGQLLQITEIRILDVN